MSRDEEGEKKYNRRMDQNDGSGRQPLPDHVSFKSPVEPSAVLMKWSLKGAPLLMRAICARSDSQTSHLPSKSRFL